MHKICFDYLLRGRDCFVSQPNKDSDGRVCVTIYNNNDAVLSFCSIWADYAQNGTMLQGVKKQSFCCREEHGYG